MHHMAAKSNLIDSSSDRIQLGRRDNGLPICPKPRRLGPAAPKFLTSLPCSHHIRSQSSGDGRGGIFSIIAEKSFEGREWRCCGCYPSVHPGSPPSRTQNPLVQDVYFVHQMELLSPFSPEKFNVASASST